MNEKKKKLLIFAIIVYFVAFCTNMSNNATGPMLNNLMMHYNVPLAKSGIFASLQNIGSVVVTFTVAVWLKKYNRARLFVVPTLFLGLTMLAIGLAPKYAVFLVLYFVMGMGIALTDVFSNALIPDLMYERKAAALSVLHGVCGLGGITMAILSGVILDSGIAWNTVYLVVGVAMLVLMAAVIIGNVTCGKEIRPYVIPSEEKGSTPIGTFLKDYRIWICLLVMITYAAAQSAVAAWTPQYCKVVFGSSALEANGALIAYWAGAAPMRILYGVTDLHKLNSKKVLIYGNIISGIVIAAGMLLNSYVAIIISVFIFGVLNAVAIPLIMAIANEYYPNDSSVTSSAMMLGLYIATIIIPVVLANSAAAWGMNAIIIIAAVLVIASGVIACFIKERK